jgi:MerR family transcriptional regulator, copper efflux regulator
MGVELTRGQLSKQARVNGETLRFYEAEGLMPEPPRSASGYRKYPNSAIQRLRFIKSAKALGFTLRDIRELLDLQEEPGSSCRHVRRKAEAKLADVDEKIRYLCEIRRALVKVMKNCSGEGPVSACSILETLNDVTPGEAMKQPLITVPAIGVGLLPKLACPMCWPVYAALLSSLGLGFLISQTYLLPITIGFLITTIGVLGFRASQRHGYGPLVMAVAASAAILVGKFGWESKPAMYLGIATLVAASVWNGWPRRIDCCEKDLRRS